jgi:hypothetical protein
MVSARDIEHMSTGWSHAYDDYRSYGAGPVTNFSYKRVEWSAVKVALFVTQSTGCRLCALRLRQHV